MTGLSCRLGDTTPNSVKIAICTLSSSPVIVTCNKTSVTASLTDLYNTEGKSIFGGAVEITALSPWTEYEYSVSNGTDVIQGKFRTAPSDQRTDFGFIVSTCENQDVRNRWRPYETIRALMSSAPEPIIAMFHIDDVLYYDTLKVSDPTTGIGSGNKPQDTGVLSDYAAAHAAYFGLIPSYPYLAKESRLWVFRNLPAYVSGGDHALEGNHCRGGIGNSDYAGCNRGATGDATGYNKNIPNLEENAKLAWDTYTGAANPSPLRAGKWHWGKDLGPIRFALFDYSLYAQPHDPAAPDPNLVGYGQEQINDIMNWMNTTSHPFKCFLHESGLCAYGQPWRDWHQNEADGWKSQFDNNAVLNGTNGNSFVVYGDNHAPHVVAYDTFWAFCSGLLENSLVVNAAQETEGNMSKLTAWGGQNIWSWHAFKDTGDRFVAGFWYFRVLASQSPRKIEATFIDSNGLVRAGPFTLLEGAVNNQWSVERRRASF